MRVPPTPLVCVECDVMPPNQLWLRRLLVKWAVQHVHAFRCTALSAALCAALAVAEQAGGACACNTVRVVLCWTPTGVQACMHAFVLGGACMLLHLFRAHDPLALRGEDVQTLLRCAVRHGSMC